MPVADTMLQDVVRECAAHGFEQVHAMALHDNSVVARMLGDYTRAVCLAYDALERTQNSSERERVLNDIGTTFVWMGRFEEARTTHLIQDATALTPEVRCIARVNLMSIAARLGEQAQFDECRDLLIDIEMPPELHANFLIESARGKRLFGSEHEAVALLNEASKIAHVHGLNRVLFEVDDMLAVPLPVIRITENDQTKVVFPDPAAHVVDGLRRMLAAFGG